MPCIIPKSTLSSRLQLLDLAARPSGLVRIAADAKARTVHLTARGTTAVLHFAVPTDFVTDDLDMTVPLEPFRKAVPQASQNVRLDPVAGKLSVSSNGQTLAELTPEDDLAELPKLAKGTPSATLPTNFALMAVRALTCASTDRSRPALCGVHLAPDGISSTDGRRLYHLPLPLPLEKPATLPASPLLAKLAAYRWESLALWEPAEGSPRFRLSGDGFDFEDNAIAQPYPKVLSVIPEDSLLDARAKFPPATQTGLCEWGKELKKATHCRFTFSGGHVKAESLDNPAMTLLARCECDCECSILLDLAYLTLGFQLGHDGIRFSRSAPAPLVATGGQGAYVFMPLGRPEQAAGKQSAPRPEQSSQTNPAAEPKAVQPQPETREETPMTTATATAPVPAAAAAARPASSPFITSPVPQQDPLERLTALLSEIRGNLTALENETAEAQRKLRELAVSQRAKERTYQDAVRKLDRIRMAV